MDCYNHQSRGEEMGAALTQYDKDLGNRIEAFSKRERYTQAKMAEFMGVPIARYKRFIYGAKRNRLWNSTYDKWN